MQYKYNISSEYIHVGFHTRGTDGESSVTEVHVPWDAGLRGELWVQTLETCDSWQPGTNTIRVCHLIWFTIKEHLTVFWKT